MNLVILKLVLPPVLILLASLAGRRYGDSIGGWLVGLPLTSGPVAVFLALQYGPEFAARATDGSLIGAGSQAGFALGYAAFAGMGWLPALAVGLCGYAAAATLAREAGLNHIAYFALALATLTLTLKILPRPAGARIVGAAPWWDLPSRMLAATVIVLGLTAAASRLGPQAAGALASVPVFGAVLAVFAHRAKGKATALEVLRGMTFALYGFACFFFVLGAMLPILGVAPAFAAALCGCLMAQAFAFAVLRRPTRAPQVPAR